jgi:hypothetical protein
MAQADYKGIKIYDKVIIVERTSTTDGGYNWKGRTVNQGYVVDVGNKKMLENAMNWARWTKHDNSILGDKWYWHKDVTEEMRKKYNDSKVTVNGVIHEYENGKFSITLDEAAGWSSQGGKLSFWNCIITGPDGHNFLVGINSELLLHLMMSTTLIKGVCQEKVWLGRVKGTQVGVFTPDMEDFAQAKKDEETRNRKKTSNYEPGDIVETITTKELYLGEVYSYASRFTERRGYSWYDRHSYIKLYKKPKKMYAYINLSYCDDDEGHSIELKATKTARTVVGKNVELKDKMLELVKKYPTEYMKLRALAYDYKRDGDTYPFSHFVENMAIRLSDKWSQEELKVDMLLAMQYQQSENPQATKDCYIEDIRFEDKPSEDEEVDKHSYFTYFSNYSKYYK